MAINEFQKYPTDKARYDKNYQKIFGSTKTIICKYCKGKGCPACNWLGSVDRRKWK